MSVPWRKTFLFCSQNSAWHVVNICWLVKQWMNEWASRVGTSDKEPSCNAGDRKICGFSPRVKKTSWRRAWQPTLVFLPRESRDRGAWRAPVYRIRKKSHFRTWPKWLSMNVQKNQGMSYHLEFLSDCSFLYCGDFLSLSCTSSLTWSSFQVSSNFLLSVKEIVGYLHLAWKFKMNASFLNFPH